MDKGRSTTDLVSAAKRVVLRALERRHFGALGKGSSYDPVTSHIRGRENIFIGKDVYLGPYAVLSADGTYIVVGDDTIVGPRLTIMAGDHHWSTPGIRYSDSPRGVNQPVAIGRNVWIGTGVTILKGVSIGDASIVAAGSVITRDIPSFAKVAGAPAKVIGARFAGEARAQHEEIVSQLGFPENSLQFSSARAAVARCVGCECPPESRPTA